MIGVIGLLFALALLMFLAFKGVSGIPASLICSLVVIVTNQVPLWKTLSVNYADGMKNFIGAYMFLFFIGACFGNLMGESGAAQRISYTFIKWFGKKSAILVVVLITSFLTYGGVSVFVVIFTIYPIAAVLFKQANYPKRLIIGCMCLGAGAYTMTALPGTPSLSNVIPTSYLGTTIYAAPVLGIISGILMFVMGMWYLNREARLALAKGDGFILSPGEVIKELTEDEIAALPGNFQAFTPILLVAGIMIVLNKMKLEAIPSMFAVIIALCVGVVAAIVLMKPFIKDPIKSFNSGATGSVGALLGTASIVGFAGVVSSVPAFQTFVTFVTGLAFGPLVSPAIAVNIIAGITASSSGGLRIFMETMGKHYLATGVNPELLHRISSIASGGLDSLPHAGPCFTMFPLVGVNHKIAYKEMFVTNLVIPLITLVIAIGLASVGIC